MSFWKTYTILSTKPQLFLILYGKSTPATDSNWRAPGLWLVLAANTAHVLRLNKADVLALNKAHVLRLNTKICPVFTAGTKETTKGGAAAQTLKRQKIVVRWPVLGTLFGALFGHFVAPGRLRTHFSSFC